MLKNILGSNYKNTENIKQKLLPYFFLLIISGLFFAGIKQDNFVARQGWGLLSAEIMLAGLTFFYLQFEQKKISSREIALISILGATAALCRVSFSALPNIKPTTFIIIISGFVFGCRAGFMVGSSAALVSNFFLGHGPWTPWQMFAWGLAGASAGLVKRVYPNIGTGGMIAFNFLWGYFFGWIMNLWFWTAFIRPLNIPSFIATFAASLWSDTFHAIGNVTFYLFFGSSFTKILKRFQRKMNIRTIER